MSEETYSAKSVIVSSVHVSHRVVGSGVENANKMLFLVKRLQIFPKCSTTSPSSKFCARTLSSVFYCDKSTATPAVVEEREHDNDNDGDDEYSNTSSKSSSSMEENEEDNATWITARSVVETVTFPSTNGRTSCTEWNGRQQQHPKHRRSASNKKKHSFRKKEDSKCLDYYNNKSIFHIVDFDPAARAFILSPSSTIVATEKKNNER